jgi:ATP-dependent Zn protease
LSDEGTAYHEAAHIVAAWDLGLAVTGATIVPNPDEDYIGCVWVPIEDRVRYALFVDEDEYLYSHLVVYLAGIEASEKYTGVSTPPEAVQLDLGSYGSDHYKVADLVLSLAGPDEDAQVEVGDRAQRHARNLIHNRRNQVETVAAALMERETLDAMECRRVLEDAFHG